MRHIRRRDELIREESSYYNQIGNQPEKEDLTGLDKSEILALIDQAIQDDDFDRVRQLNAELGSNPMTESTSYLARWDTWRSINESVQEAKVTLQNLADREIKAMKDEFEKELESTREEDRPARLAELKQAVLDKYLRNPDVEEIKQLFASQPKYIGPFVKFKFIQSAPMEVIRDLHSSMVRFKASLEDLPKKIEEYASHKPSKDHPEPGYEILGDDLNKLMELSRGRWLVQALPSKAMSTSAHAAAGFSPINLREAFRNSPKEKQTELLKLAAALSDLNKPALIKAVNVKLSGLPSIDEVIDYVRLQINNADTDRGKLMEQAMSSYPSVAVMYEGPDHVVFSFRNDSQLPNLCSKAKGWCIQPSWYNTGYADRFWNYADGSLQLGIIDFTVDPSDPHHTVGATIKPNGSVTSMCDQPNSCTSGNNFRELFTSFSTSGKTHSYPKELIDAVDLNFNQEVNTKTASDSLYKKIKAFSEGERDKNQAMIKTLTGLIRNLNDLVQDTGLSQSDMSVNSAGNTAKQIVASEIENLKNSEVINTVRAEYIDQVRKSGLVSPADVKIFDIVMSGSDKYNADLLKSIAARNLEFIRVIETNTARATGKAAEHWKIIVNGIKDSLEYIKAIQEKL